MAYIKITPERLEQVRQTDEHIKAWFGYTDRNHKYCTHITRYVHYSGKGTYVTLDGKRVYVEQHSTNTFYVI